MHEQMQHGTQEEQDVRQDTEDVRAVFHEEEKRDNGAGCQEDPSARGAEPLPYP
jgi:hypothetical protein